MSSELSLLFYIATFSLSVVLVSIGLRKKIRLFAWTGLLVPILVSGLRLGVGTDYYTYVSLYNSLKNYTFSEYLQGGPTEIGFYLIGTFSRMIGDSEMLMFFGFSMLTVIFFYLGLNRYQLRHKSIIYFLFIFTIYPGSFNLVRQSAAISIAFYANSFLLEKKRVKFLLLMLLAGTVHVSALIAIPLLYFNYIFSEKKELLNSSWRLKASLVKALIPTVVITALLPFTFIILGQLGVFEKYIQYESVDLTGNNYSFFLKLFIFTGISIFAHKIIKNAQDRAFFGLSAMEVSLVALGFITSPLKRIAMYFSIYPLLLLPKIVDMFTDKLGKTLSYTLIILFGISYFIFSFYILGQAEIFPYEFVGLTK